MFIKITEHYKGRYPLDIGGLVFSGPNPREVEDKFGELLAKSNYPVAVPCTKDGTLLMKIPPLPGTVKPVPEKEPEQPKSQDVALPASSPEVGQAPEPASSETPGDSLGVEIVVQKRGRK